MGLRAVRNQDHPHITGKERTFAEHEIIVSKTDTRGIITYANDVFLSIADYTEKEVIGKPHNLIRHPHMPHGVFKLFWEHLKSGREIFAYVVNRTKYGDHYWVLAHATPSRDAQGQITGYHSSRRVPKRAALSVIEPLYQQMREVEGRHNSPRDGCEASYAMLMNLLQEKGKTYDEFILSL